MGGSEGSTRIPGAGTCWYPMPATEEMERPGWDGISARDMTYFVATKAIMNSLEEQEASVAAEQLERVLGEHRREYARIPAAMSAGLRDAGSIEHNRKQVYESLGEFVINSQFMYESAGELHMRAGNCAKAQAYFEQADQIYRVLLYGENPDKMSYAPDFAPQRRLLQEVHAVLHEVADDQYPSDEAVEDRLDYACLLLLRAEAVDVFAVVPTDVQFYHVDDIEAEIERRFAPAEQALQDAEAYFEDRYLAWFYHKEGCTREELYERNARIYYDPSNRERVGMVWNNEVRIRNLQRDMLTAKASMYLDLAGTFAEVSPETSLMLEQKGEKLWAEVVAQEAEQDRKLAEINREIEAKLGGALYEGYDPGSSADFFARQALELEETVVLEE